MGQLGGPAARHGGGAARVVVVGAATRDINVVDRRGWQLGGPVTYASLSLARLGLRVTTILGADPLAAEATELALLRDAGVDLRIVGLRHGPVFENHEGPTGRLQRIRTASDEIPPEPGLMAGIPDARGWFLAPVAGELADAWVDVIPAHACVAMGWQGLLRSFQPDGTVLRRVPVSSPLLRRASLVGVSRDDLAADASLDALADVLAPDATLVVTHGRAGGMQLEPRPDGRRRLRRYGAVAAGSDVDVTGAGDTFLAAMFAARLEPRLVGGRRDRGFDLLLAAAVASLVVEGEGLAGVPTRDAIRHRVRAALSGRRA